MINISFMTNKNIVVIKMINEYEYRLFVVKHLLLL